MLDSVTLLHCLAPTLPRTTVRQLSRIVLALLAMTGRVTMRGIARWTGDGGSYRTVQRFFATTLPWASLFWLFFRTQLFRRSAVYLLGGDETVVTKSGKRTQGLERFFAGLYGKPVPGLAFFALSLLSIQQRRSCPIQIAQVVRTAEEKAAARAKQRVKAVSDPACKRTPGRPKGSTTVAKTAGALTPERTRMQTRLGAVMTRSGTLCPVTYLVLDGHFGNNNALQMTRRCQLHLISKLRADSARSLPSVGPYAGRGPRRISGAKLDVQALPAHTLRQTTDTDGIITRISQVAARHKSFAQPLNLVVIGKTNQQTQRQAHVLLFSSDPALPCAQMIDDYGLRFQLEFNFREAKQYWGLEDFMPTTPTAVTNAANLACFMVNFAERLLQDGRQHQPDWSVLDLKAHYRGSKYVEETIKLLPERPEPIVVARIRAKLVGLGRIHAAPADSLAA
jgi:putative transposase